MHRDISWANVHELDAIIDQLDLIALQDERYTQMWLFLRSLYMSGHSHHMVWGMGPRVLGISDNAFRKRVWQFRQRIVRAYWQAHDDEEDE